MACSGLVLRRILLTTSLSALFATLLYSLYGYVDPFGVKQAAARQSDAVLNRLFLGPRYDSAARDRITVILLDDAFVAQQRDQWPLSYNTQEWLLSSIARHRPKAIYLDFLYRQRHHAGESMQQFQDGLEQVAAKTPLFVPLLVDAQHTPGSCVSRETARPVALAGEVVEERSVIPEVRRPGVRFTYIGWNGCGERYPAMLYRNLELPTPAFALLRATCEEDPAFSDVCKSVSDATSFEDPMHLVWGSGISKLHRTAARATGAECTYIDKDDRWAVAKFQLRQIGAVASQMWTRVEERGIGEACTYTDTLHGLWFDSFDPEVTRHVESLIKDRIVLVGAKVDGVPDLITSPVNGQVPGVYLFAMALDNYLQYGTDYYRSATIDSGFLPEAAIFFGLFFVLSLGWEVFVGNACPRAGENPTRASTVTLRQWVRMLFWVAVFRFVLPLALGLTLVVVYRYVGRLPLDWISLIGVAFIVSPASVADCLGERPLTVLLKNLRLWPGQFDRDRQPREGAIADGPVHDMATSDLTVRGATTPTRPPSAKPHVPEIPS